MSPFSPHRSQRGVTLVIALIMLVLLTLIVTTAFSLSTTNLKSVGNMQVRDEAIAAANFSIEQILGSDFTAAPAAETIAVDIDNDEQTDYTVEVSAPACIRATQATGTYLNDEDHPGGSTSSWNTTWDIVATVTDSKTGAYARIHQGAIVLLSETKKNDVCS